MGAINPNILYGAVRGFEDTERLGREREAFTQDQAIRAERLKQEQTLAPLRTQALELGIKESEGRMAAEAEERPLRSRALNLQLKVAEMTAEEKALYNKLAKQAQERRQQLHVALASGDPNEVAKAMASWNPALSNPRVEQGPDGSLNFTVEKDGKPITRTYAPSKTPSGRAVSAWDAMAIDATSNLDPVKKFETMQQHEWELEKEKAKQETIGAGRLAVARATGEAQEGARQTAEMNTHVRTETGRIKEELDAAFKTSTQVGQLISGYANTEDAALRLPIAERADAIIRDGAKKGEKIGSNKAVAQAVNEYRTRYDKVASTAANLAAPLFEAKVDPKNEDALKALAEKDPNARKLLQLFALTERHFGIGVRKHLQNSLTPKAKPKK